MKNYHSKLLWIVLSLLIVFSGCSEDGINENPEEVIPELQFNTDRISVKVGNDNKYILEVMQGGGEYNVFSLSDEIAKVEISGEKILIEGIANGKTFIVVSDKNGFYKKLPVQVYTTDKMELKDYSLELTTLLGHSGTLTTAVLLGNGSYRVASDNTNVQVSISEDGTITITGTSKPDILTVNITVTDASDLSAVIVLTVKSSTAPFSDEDLKSIMSENTRRYYLNGKNTAQTYYSYYNKLDNGQQLYGWDLYNYYYYKLWYTGDKSVGKKQDAKLSCYYGQPPAFSKEPVDFEIIKNDGTNIWAIFTFIKDDMLQYGYFCDKI
jgi:hypothetical protein